MRTGLENLKMKLSLGVGWGIEKEADPQAQGSFWEWGEDGPPGYLPLSDLIHLFFSALCSLYSDGLQDKTPAR